MKNHTPNNNEKVPDLPPKWGWVNWRKPPVFASLVPAWDPEVTKTSKYHVFCKNHTLFFSYCVPFELAYFFSNFLFDALYSPCSMAGLNVRLLGVRRWHAAGVFDKKRKLLNWSFPRSSLPPHSLPWSPSYLARCAAWQKTRWMEACVFTGWLDLRLYQHHW